MDPHVEEQTEAGWLETENMRLRAEIERLTLHVSRLEAVLRELRDAARVIDAEWEQASARVLLRDIAKGDYP